MGVNQPPDSTSQALADRVDHTDGGKPQNSPTETPVGTDGAASDKSKFEEDSITQHAGGEFTPHDSDGDTRFEEYQPGKTDYVMSEPQLEPAGTEDSIEGLGELLGGEGVEETEMTETGEIGSGPAAVFQSQMEAVQATSGTLVEGLAEQEGAQETEETGESEESSDIDAEMDEIAAEVAQEDVGEGEEVEGGIVAEVMNEIIDEEMNAHLGTEVLEEDLFEPNPDAAIPTLNTQQFAQEVNTAAQGEFQNAVSELPNGAQAAVNRFDALEDRGRLTDDEVSNEVFEDIKELGLEIKEMRYTVSYMKLIAKVLALVKRVKGLIDEMDQLMTRDEYRREIANFKQDIKIIHRQIEKRKEEMEKIEEKFGSVDAAMAAFDAIMALAMIIPGLQALAAALQTVKISISMIIRVMVETIKQAVMKAVQGSVKVSSKKAAQAAAKAALKAAMKEGAKSAVKEGTKSGLKEAIKNVTMQSIKEAMKEAPKILFNKIKSFAMKLVQRFSFKASQQSAQQAAAKAAQKAMVKAAEKGTEKAATKALEKALVKTFMKIVLKKVVAQVGIGVLLLIMADQARKGENDLIGDIAMMFGGGQDSRWKGRMAIGIVMSVLSLGAAAPAAISAAMMEKGAMDMKNNRTRLITTSEANDAINKAIRNMHNARMKMMQSSAMHQSNQQLQQMMNQLMAMLTQLIVAVQADGGNPAQMVQNMSKPSESSPNLMEEGAGTDEVVSEEEVTEDIVESTVDETMETEGGTSTEESEMEPMNEMQSNAMIEAMDLQMLQLDNLVTQMESSPEQVRPDMMQQVTMQVESYVEVINMALMEMLRQHKGPMDPKMQEAVVRHLVGLMYKLNPNHPEDPEEMVKQFMQLIQEQEERAYGMGQALAGLARHTGFVGEDDSGEVGA